VVAGDKGDKVLQHEWVMGSETGSMVAGSESSPLRGGGGGTATVASVSGGCGSALVAQHGQEIKEGEGGARALLEKEKEGEKRWSTDGAVPVLTQHGWGRGGGPRHGSPCGEQSRGAPYALSTPESAVGTVAA
jgi:hypothetical protein